MLEVDGVSCYYGAARVLKGVDLSAGKGEFFGIIGPNGSGKTTLLKCIAAIINPKAGSIVLDERDVSTLRRKELAKDVAAVSQDSRGDAPFTAMEVVLMGRIPHLRRFQSEGREDLDIAERVMEQTNSLHLADRPISELSGGERQRVLIARALAQEPKLLLLDEPTANLDITYQLETMNLIRRMSEQQGMTVIVAIHDLNLAAQYCNRMALLSGGEIIAIGAPEDVLTPVNIKKAFKVDVTVKRHEMTSSLYVTPMQEKTEPVENKDTKVHIICGGGTGTSLLNQLVRWGYRVSTGVLNVLDTDYETAQSLGLTVVDEAPFSPITKDSHHVNLQLIEGSDLVVMTTLPFGAGNIQNLRAAKHAVDRGIPVAIFKTSLTNHDFMLGEAEDLLNELKSAGIRTVSSTAELKKLIEGLK